MKEKFKIPTLVIGYIIFMLIMGTYIGSKSENKSESYDEPTLYQLAFNDTCRYQMDTVSRKITSSTNALTSFFQNNHKIVYLYSSAALYVSTDPAFTSNVTDYIPAATLFSNWPERATRFFTNYYIKAVDTSAAVTYRIRLEGY